MFRLIRVPSAFDDFFRTLQTRFHCDHCEYFRLIVITITFMWGRRNVASIYRYLDAPRHRSHYNNLFLVVRRDPEAALRQKAQEQLRALHPSQEKRCI